MALCFQGNHYKLSTDDQGNFEIALGALEMGGPYELVFISVVYGEYTIKDVYVGETFVASGQSNMELPMRRVRVAFPEEWEKNPNPMIRLFKVAERIDFHVKQDDFLQGEWVALSPETLDEFSAVGYFFESLLYEETKVPIGIIQASYGGTPIEAWLPKELLLDEGQELLASYEEDSFVREQIRKNEVQEKTWYEKLEHEDFKLQDLVWPNKQSVSIPCYFRDFVEEGFCGSIWFKREFQVKKGESKDAWILHLGTLVDADDAYMKDDHMRNAQLKPGYNLQIGVESEYVISTGVYADRSDVATLIPFLENLHDHPDISYKNIIADAAYESEENYLYLEAHQQTAMYQK